MPPALYQPVAASSFPLTHDVSLVFAHDRGQVTEIDPFAARVLTVLSGRRTLHAHAEAVVQAGVSSDRTIVSGALRRLIGAGALRRAVVLPPEGGSQRRGSPNASAAAPTTVAIVTADRPRMLERCIESLARDCGRSTHRPRILVVDGSRHARHRAANRRASAAAARTTAHVVTYVGQDEAAALRARLAAAGVPDAVLQFALTPGTTGANRNLAVLLSRGEHVLLLDDDMVCAPWTAADAAPGVVIGGDEEPRTFDFFDTRRDALAAGLPAATGLLDAHGDLLGARLTDLAGGAEPIDLTTATADLLDAIDAGRDYRVRATFPGLAGDSGTSCPHLLLFATGALKSRLHDSTAFATALSSREVTRIATRHTVTRLPNCMAGCMGLANGAVVPPFLPTGRNSDGLFGVMFHFADRAALFGHLRYGIVHDSDRAPSYGFDAIPSATGVRLADLLISLTRRVGFTSFAASPAARLERLADALSEVASLPGDELIARVTKITLEDRCRRLAELEIRISRDRTYPGHWRAAVDRYTAAFRASAARPDFWLPIELAGRGRGSHGRAVERLRRFVREFAELVRWWPRMLTLGDRAALAAVPRRVRAAVPPALHRAKPAAHAGPVHQVVPEHDGARGERPRHARRRKPRRAVDRRTPRVPAAPESVEHS